MVGIVKVGGLLVKLRYYCSYHGVRFNVVIVRLLTYNSEIVILQLI
jgi:hypothetical protein